MATYNIVGFPPGAFSTISGGGLESVGGQFRLDPAWDAADDAYSFEIDDNDNDFQGDASENETGDDTSQSAVVRNASGSTVASGQTYLEQSYTFTDEFGNTVNIYRVEIGGTHVGYIADGPIQPGNTYTTTSSSNVTNSDSPDYSEFEDTTYDPDAANSATGTSNADSIEGGASADSVDAGGGNDTLDGGSGADTIEGGDGNDSISGGTGNDSLDGQDGNDTIQGGNDNDTLVGGAGNDQLDGESGDDTFVYHSSYVWGDDTVVGGETGETDGDTIDLSQVTVPVTVTYSGDESGTITDGTNTISFSEIENLILTDQADVVDASSDSQGINVEAGDGNDTMLGGSGADSINGGGGDDCLRGGNGNDTLSGGAGNDSINGENDDDSISGGSGSDTIWGDAGNDTLSGDTGNDTLGGGSGDDSLDGGDGDDSISGDEGDDTLIGGDGDDTLAGGEGADSFEGGIGLDFIDYSLSDSAVTVDLSTRTASGGHATGDTFVGIDGIIGSAFDDSLTGFNLASADFTNIIDGGAGNDTIDGKGADDTLIGGSGDDSIIGGTGDDEITGGTGNDTIVYAIGDGHDTITDFNTGNTGTLLDGDNTNNDFINLSAFYDNLSELYADQADDGVLNQSNATDSKGRSTDYSDNSEFGADDSLTFQSASADNSSFTQENTGVVCFNTGTAILTPGGNVLIDDLSVGDLVITMDNGPQAIRWIGTRKISHAQLLQEPKLRPVLIPKGALGAERNLFISRQHAVLTSPDHLVRAIHLTRVDNLPIRIAHGKREVTYFHIMFDTHQIVFAENVPSESFFPGTMAFEMFAPSTRQKFFGEFPEFKRPKGSKGLAQIYGQRARPVVKNLDNLSGMVAAVEP